MVDLNLLLHPPKEMSSVGNELEVFVNKGKTERSCHNC